MCNYAAKTFNNSTCACYERRCYFEEFQYETCLSDLTLSYRIPCAFSRSFDDFSENLTDCSCEDIEG